MPISLQFEESCERTTPEDVHGGSRGAAEPQSRAVPVSQPVKATESQRFRFAASVKEALLADQEAERIVREEEETRLALEADEDTEDEEESFPGVSVAEVCAFKRRPSQAVIDVHHLPRRKRRSPTYSWSCVILSQHASLHRGWFEKSRLLWWLVSHGGSFRTPMHQNQFPKRTTLGREYCDLGASNPSDGWNYPDQLLPQEGHRRRKAEL